MRGLLLILLTMSFLGCSTWSAKRFAHSPEPGMPIKLMHREVDVITALLSSQYAKAIARKKPLVIDEMTIAETHPFERFARDKPEGLPASAIHDYLRRNAKALRLGSELGPLIPVRFLSSADLKQIFADDDGWKRFRRYFPGSPGSIQISRVGFSKDGGHAILYLGQQSDWESGIGGVWYLRKENDRWIVIEQFGPIWSRT